jgi:hypothetical protein
VDDTSSKIRPAGVPDYPLRALVIHEGARAAFLNAEDAGEFLEHPGHLPAMARAYLAWAGEQGEGEK